MTSSQSGLRLLNDSEGSGDGWYRWSLWLEGSAEELSRVSKVTYRLHPTFTPATRVVADRSTKFALQEAGWGEFLVAADVELTGGSSLRLERWLELATRSSDTSPVGIAEARPRVFVSASVADAKLVHSLQEALKRNGIDIMTAESMDVGEDWSFFLQQQMRTVAAVVPVFSDPTSQWVLSEAREALKLGRPLVPVVLGEARIPPALESAEFVHSAARDGDAAAVDTIVARLKDIVTPEET